MVLAFLIFCTTITIFIALYSLLNGAPFGWMLFHMVLVAIQFANIAWYLSATSSGV